jgi:hypothetical protein
MRELARRLDVWPNAVLYHVPHKEKLLGLLIDAVLRDVVVPPRDLPWMERMRRVSLDFRSCFLPYPGLAPVLLTRAGLTPRVQELNRETVMILLDAGFDEANAAKAFTSIYTYILGTLSLSRPARREPDRPLGVPSDDVAGAGGGHADLAERIGEALRAMDPEEQFVYGLDVIMTGLEAERLRLVDRRRAVPRRR